MTTHKGNPRALFTLFLVFAAGLLLLTSGTASAAPPIAEDGRIHACYKAKGKAKGTLRVVRSGKVRCPRKWRKVAWGATPPAGPRGAAGSPGPGSTVVIAGLEDRVSRLQAEVEGLRSILKGITNQELLAAIQLAPLVQELCSQTSALTGQLNLLEGVLGGLSLNDVLALAGGLLNIPALPGALPAFSC